MSKLTRRNKEHLDSMIIGSGHTIMAGFIPSRIPATEFSEKFYEWAKSSPESISQFGFWGGDIDYNTYYPDLSPDELTPKDEEFIEPMFRLLSATIVSKNYNPTDFGQNGVLKASMKMLLGQTVNCDHETNIGNAIGAVSKVVWQEPYKDGNFFIPGGINGVLKIDGKANPRIARGILMEPPSIHSNSVTVQFKWDKSHPDMSDEEFYQKLGSYDSKGNMVRRVVTEVVRYLETSLVSHGADAFAQKIGQDGKIINPDFAKRTWSSYSEYVEDTAKQYYFTDFKDNQESYHENNDTRDSLNNNGNSIINNNPTKNMNELNQFIASLVADGMLTLAEGTEHTPENIVLAVQALIAERDQFKGSVQTLTTEKTSLTEQITSLNTEVANLKEMATVGTNYIQSLRENVVANYKKLKGDEVDETIITMINADTTGLLTLKSLEKEYSAQLEEKFPFTCSACGSKDVSRASSAKLEEKTTEEEKLNEVTPNSVLFDNIYKKKIK